MLTVSAGMLRGQGADVSCEAASPPGGTKVLGCLCRAAESKGLKKSLQ